MKIAAIVTLALSIVGSIAFTYEVANCKVLSSWKPRFGSRSQSCNGEKVEGTVWAHERMQQ